MFPKSDTVPCTSPHCREGPTDEETEEQFFGNPPNKQELGSAAWLCMHTGAANIRQDEGWKFSAWLRSLLDMYPCQDCKRDFDLILKDFPIPRTGDVRVFTTWVCEFHNKVNKSLNMQEFPCNCDDLLKQYKWPASD
eukprot:Gregarina_sp_Poly_1__1799@NODE_1467_length_4065_cov_76_270635_g971_i0_p3_GENE_NODE_1467_length_4065_cov_76_270635_g971_i0NODE_1467_length_4065_cov_76_270635_g971_i0_p3_ORF_typecomplete_len137_score18_39Evr1_Alr/PF04777_13/1e15_NODE_1467_length_4065_cov_76_270635_g971_i019212331